MRLEKGVPAPEILYLGNIHMTIYHFQHFQNVWQS